MAETDAPTRPAEAETPTDLQIALRARTTTNDRETSIMKRRGIFIGFAVGVVAMASIAVAVAAYMQRLPDPEQADQHGLFRWLVQTNLREEPQDVQNRLLNRVERELSHGIDLSQCLTQINSEQCARLLKNVDRLAECWFLREADRYFASPAAKRSEVIQKQAERVEQLGIFQQMASLESHGQAAAKESALADSARRLNRWLADVAPQQRQRVTEYFSTLRGALVWNSLRQWISPLKLDGAKSSATKSSMVQPSGKQTAA